MNDADSILQARARALAREPRARGIEQADNEVITFTLGRDTYGVAARHVREVYRPRDLSVLPGAEPPVHAVVPWRGVLLTVLDLRASLGVGASGITDLSHLLVLGIDLTSVGVLIHTVHAIEALAGEALLAAPGRGQRDDELLRGVTRNGVLVLDAERILERYG
jgi:chemotaxis signal transduction protein